MTAAPEPCCRLAVIGRGRMGTALTRALGQAGIEVLGPIGREFDAAGLAARADAALLCVPDGQIAAVARRLPPRLLVGHCSGATGLDALAPHEAFSLHPLMTLPAPDARETQDAPDTGPRPSTHASPFAGAGCAVAGTTDRARDFGLRLARALELRPIEVGDDDRVAYHAAATIASNFLVTLEAAAERLARTTGVDRALLVPLVRSTVENWARLGPERALTGPIARGDEETVARQRDALAERSPDLLELFDALADATRALAAPAELAPPEPAPPASTARAPAAPDPSPNGSAPHKPRLVRRITDLRAALEPARAAGQTIGLVPTMGALHEGHLSLIRRAASDCDQVVVSIFVNPTQFGPGEDLDRYPRDEAADAARAAAAGATILFAPPAGEVYPPGHATSVTVAGLTEGLCGATRGPDHFTGVATVVAKLLNMVQPGVAYFGQKDAQQAAILRRMVRDLDIPVRIEVLPTLREPDGLALSSRNAYLNPGERTRAVALRRALDAAQRAVAHGERSAAAIAAHTRREMANHQVTPEYVEVVDPDTLAPLTEITGPALVAVAAHLGPARLIDNTVVRPPPQPRRTPTPVDPRPLPQRRPP